MSGCMTPLRVLDFRKIGHAEEGAKAAREKKEAEEAKEAAAAKKKAAAAEAAGIQRAIGLARRAATGAALAFSTQHGAQPSELCSSLWEEQRSTAARSDGSR